MQVTQKLFHEILELKKGESLGVALTKKAETEKSVLIELFGQLCYFSKSEAIIKGVDETNILKLIEQQMESQNGIF